MKKKLNNLGLIFPQHVLDKMNSPIRLKKAREKYGN